MGHGGPVHRCSWLWSLKLRPRLQQRKLILQKNKTKTQSKTESPKKKNDRKNHQEKHKLNKQTKQTKINTWIFLIFFVGVLFCLFFLCCFCFLLFLVFWLFFLFAPFLKKCMKPKKFSALLGSQLSRFGALLSGRYLKSSLPQNSRDKINGGYVYSILSHMIHGNKLHVFWILSNISIHLAETWQKHVAIARPQKEWMTETTLVDVPSTQLIWDLSRSLWWGGLLLHASSGIRVPW